MEKEDIVKRAKKTVKDSVFRDIFQNRKNLLRLYKELHPEDKDVKEEQIGSVTIKNVLIDKMYNDLGFMVRSKLLLLVEAQATWSVNIVIRALMYLANTWQEYIENNKLNVYGSRKIKIPKPELYVIYTGERNERPEWISLSNEFFEGQSMFLEAKAKVIYGGKKGDIINEYITFTKVYDEQVREHGRTREAVLETIKICKEMKVLEEYLKDREKEVVDIMTTLFNQEYAMERYGDEREAEGLAQGVKKGLAQGEIKAKQETAYELRDEEGFSIERIAKLVKVNVETVKKWFSERATFKK